MTPEPTTGSVTGQLLLLEGVALLVLVVGMYLNSRAGTGGGLFSNGGLFFQQPRPPSARELLRHEQLALAAAGLPLLALGAAAWRRRWVLAGAHLPVIVVMLTVASTLTPRVR